MVRSLWRCTGSDDLAHLAGFCPTGGTISANSFLPVAVSSKEGLEPLISSLRFKAPMAAPRFGPDTGQVSKAPVAIARKTVRLLAWRAVVLVFIGSLRCLLGGRKARGFQ